MQFYSIYLKELKQIHVYPCIIQLVEIDLKVISN